MRLDVYSAWKAPAKAVAPVSIALDGSENLIQTVMIFYGTLTSDVLELL